MTKWAGDRDVEIGMYTGGSDNKKAGIQLPPIVTPQEAMKPSSTVLAKAAQLVSDINKHLRNIRLSKTVAVYEYDDYIRQLVKEHFETHWCIHETYVDADQRDPRDRDYYNWTFTPK